jgi:NitT/TauT family transport system substrate-binding protein
LRSLAGRLEKREYSRQFRSHPGNPGTLVVAPLALSAPAAADGALKIASGGRGNWDASPSELGRRAGIFKKHGLDLDILFTAGGGEL